MATQTETIRTREEIDKLKADWENDPCWDLEETEGFQAHRAELFEFSTRRQFEWKRQRNLELKSYARKLGLPGNTKLAGYIQQLENRLAKLEAGEKR